MSQKRVLKKKHSRGEDAWRWALMNGTSRGTRSVAGENEPLPSGPGGSERGWRVAPFGAQFSARCQSVQVCRRSPAFVRWISKDAPFFFEWTRCRVFKLSVLFFLNRQVFVLFQVPAFCHRSEYRDNFCFFLNLTISVRVIENNVQVKCSVLDINLKTILLIKLPCFLRTWSACGKQTHDKARE